MRISDWSSDVCSSDLLAAWQEKAVREAKRHSGWTEPNLAYEAACRSFLERLLSTHDVFVSELAGFVASIAAAGAVNARSEEHTSELQSLMRISYAVFCLKKKKQTTHTKQMTTIHQIITSTN